MVSATACKNAEWCAGCVDSLPVFQKMLSSRKSNKQKEIARNLLGATYSVHDASNDAMVLGSLLDGFIY